MLILPFVGISLLLITQTASSLQIQRNVNYPNNTTTKKTYYCGIATRLLDTNIKAAQNFCDYQTTNLDFWWNWDIQPHFDYDNDDNDDNDRNKSNITNSTTTTTILEKMDFNKTKDCLKDKFIPMIYGVNVEENSKKATNIGLDKYNNNAIMGYNEPDLYAPGAASGTWTPNFQCGRNAIAKDWQSWVISYLSANPNGIIISPAMTSYTGGIWPNDTTTTTTSSTTTDSNNSDDGEDEDYDDDTDYEGYFNYTTSNNTSLSPSQAPSSFTPDSICNNAKQQSNNFQRDCLGWLQCFKNNVIQLNCGTTDCWNIISIIQFHSYMYTSKEFITKVQSYENAWKNDLLGINGMSTKTLWVTEFAKAGITNPNKVDSDTKEFIYKTIQYMKDSPYVSGWSWFSENEFKSFYIDGLQPTSNYWSSNLFNIHNGRPTKLGKLYFDACSNNKGSDDDDDDDDGDGTDSSPGDDNNATKTKSKVDTTSNNRSGNGNEDDLQGGDKEISPSSSPSPVDTTAQPKADMTPTSLRSSIDIATTTTQQQQRANAPSMVVEDEAEEGNDFNRSSSSSLWTKQTVISLLVLVLFIFFLVRLLIHLPVWQQACGSISQSIKTKRSLYRTIPSDTSSSFEDDGTGCSSTSSSKTNNSRNNRRHHGVPHHPKHTQKKRDPNLYQPILPTSMEYKDNNNNNRNINYKTNSKVQHKQQRKQKQRNDKHQTKPSITSSLDRYNDDDHDNNWMPLL